MYLRWTRFVMFQLTSILCLITTALSIWGLKVGNDQRALAASMIPGATLDIADALGVGGAVTAAATVASFLCLLMQYYILKHKLNPTETVRSVMIKEGLFSFACILWLATLIPATVINFTRSGVITKPGVPDSVIASIVALSGQDLRYSVQHPIRYYTIFGWLAFLSTLINLVLVSLAARYILKHQHTRDVNSPPGRATSSGGSTLDVKGEKSHFEHV